jgi:uncharacterized protein
VIKSRNKSYHYRQKQSSSARKIGILISYILIFFVGYLVAYETIPTSQKSIQVLVPLATEYSSASANILAVKSDESMGVMGNVLVEIVTGKDRVLMNTNPFLEPDTQYSAETAVKVAETVTGKSLDDKDVIVSFNITGQVLGGPSAGAAMTIATIGAIEGKEVKKDVAITGTIESTGKIGPIGGVLEKAEAAASNGVKLFLVPKGELYLTYYEREVKQERIGKYIIQRYRYVPKTIDVNNYTMTEWDMETKEVSTINDAVKYMLA